MAVSANDVIRVVCKMSWGEDDIQNVYHGKVTGGTLPSDAVLLTGMSTFFDALYDLIDTNFPDEITFDSISVYNVTQDIWVGEVGWDSLVTGGGSATDPMPPQVAPLILFNTGVLRSQGRKYLPPCTEAANDTDATPVAGFLTAMGNYAAGLLAGASFAGWDVAWGNYRKIGAIFIPWIDAEVRDIWGSQRRRMFGRGS
jgi:hypothetical protein